MQISWFDVYKIYFKGSNMPEDFLLELMLVVCFNNIDADVGYSIDSGIVH
jgi:hypothetical protein